MSILFKPENHEYQSIDTTDNIKWISVTTLIGKFKQPFNGPVQAEKSARNRKSKWYKMSVQDILAVWKNESTRAIGLGTWYHNEREADLCGLNTLSRWGKDVPVFKPNYDELGNKIAPPQKLSDGIYPEHFVYLKSAGICGQSDLVEIVNGKVHITDYKTNKEIKTEGYKSYDGVIQKMSGPVSHLDDCNLIHYNLQLSMYLYMIIKHNPKLQPGNLTLHHVVFEEHSKDQFGYPVAKLDMVGNPIVEAVVPYELPYMRQEVIAIINWLNDNRDKVSFKKNQ